MSEIEIHRKNGEIEKRPKSIGGQIFDWVTYGGLAGVGTFFLTIPMANLFLKESGRLHKYDTGLQNGLKKLGATADFSKNTSAAVHTGWGGILMVFPVMLLEHFRAPIVIGLNRLFGDKTDPASVKDAPPQTWGSVIQARLLAFVTIFSSFNLIGAALGQDRFDGLLEKAGEGLCHLLHRPVEVMKDGKKIFSKTYNFGHTGALDILATTAAATIFYVGSHFFSRKAEEKKLRHHDKAKPAGVGVNTPAPALANAPSTQISHAERDDRNLAVNTAAVPAL